MTHHRRHVRNLSFPTTPLAGAVRAAVLALLVTLVAAGPAWAVALEIVVTGPGGEPVEGATVDLGLGAPPVETGADGRATVEVDEDDLGRETEAVVTFRPDPSTGTRPEAQRVPVELDAGGVTIRLPRMPSFPPAAGPGRSGLPRLGCYQWGGKLQFQLGAGTGEVEGAPLERQFFDFEGTINGMVVEQSSGLRSAADLASINRTEKKTHEVDTEGQVAVRVPLRPGVCERGSGVVAVPSLTLGARRVDATFESVNPGMPALGQSFWGDGNAWSGGFDTTILRHGSRQLWNVGVEYGRTETLDVERSVDLATTFFDPRAVTLSDQATYRQEWTGARVFWGYSFDRALPYFGAQYTWFEADLDLDSQVDLTALAPTAPPGTLIISDNLFENLFEDDYVQAVAGVIAKIAGSLAVQAEGRVGEDTSSLTFSLGIFIP